MSIKRHVAAACTSLVLAIAPVEANAAKIPCLASFDGPQLNHPAPPRTPKSVRCVDGDPDCDADGIPNGVCSFAIAVCTNPVQAGCLSPGIARVEINNKPLGHRRHNASLASLQENVDSLLFPALATQCSDPQHVHVPLKGPRRNGLMKKSKTLKIKAKSAGVDGSKDVDTIKLQCVPRPLPDGCKARSEKMLLRKLRKHPAAEAVFYDVFSMALEAGYGGTLKPVLECKTGDTVTYTAGLERLDGYAALSVTLRRGLPGAWARLIRVTDSGALLILDRTGGVSIENAGTENQIVTPVLGPIEIPSATSARGSLLPSEQCLDTYVECLGETSFWDDPEAKDLMKVVVREGAIGVACLGLSTLFPASFVVTGGCIASSIASFVEVVGGVWIIRDARKDCDDRLFGNGWDCTDHGSDCAKLGVCASQDGLLVCRGFGDKCRSQDPRLACRDSTGQCAFIRCGDGFMDRRGPDGKDGTTDDEECEDDMDCVNGGSCNPDCKCDLVCPEPHTVCCLGPWSEFNGCGSEFSDPYRDPCLYCDALEQECVEGRCENPCADPAVCCSSNNPGARGAPCAAWGIFGDDVDVGGLESLCKLPDLNLSVQSGRCLTGELCVPDRTRECDTGLLGICQAGERTCHSDGSGYGFCLSLNDALPNEICGDDLDNDCDGQTNEGCDVLTPTPTATPTPTGTPTPTPTVTAPVSPGTPTPTATITPGSACVEGTGCCELHFDEHDSCIEFLIGDQSITTFADTCANLAEGNGLDGSLAYCGACTCGPPICCYSPIGGVCFGTTYSVRPATIQPTCSGSAVIDGRCLDHCEAPAMPEPTSSAGGEKTG